MRLIIEADDFGLSESISNGIIDGINGGILLPLTLWQICPLQNMQLKKRLKTK